MEQSSFSFQGVVWILVISFQFGDPSFDNPRDLPLVEDPNLLALLPTRYFDERTNQKPPLEACSIHTFEPQMTEPLFLPQLVRVISGPNMAM